MNQVTQYIKTTLTGDKGNIQSILLFKDIAIDKISCNEAMTVIYVFWQLEKKISKDELSKMSLDDQALYRYKNMVKRLHVNQDQDTKKSTEEKINKRLNKFSSYFSGMICRDLGFKYGPEIRFVVSKKDEREKDLKKEMAEVVPDIMKKKLFEKFEKGEIESKISKGKFNLDVNQALIDLESRLEANMESDQSLIASAKAQQKAEKNQNKPDRKTLRNKNNKDEFGNKKKKKKTKKSQQFWDSLEAY